MHYVDKECLRIQIFWNATQVPEFSKAVRAFETSEISKRATQFDAPEDLKPNYTTVKASNPVRTIFTTHLPNAEVQ